MATLARNPTEGHIGVKAKNADDRTVVHSDHGDALIIGLKSRNKKELRMTIRDRVPPLPPIWPAMGRMLADLERTPLAQNRRTLFLNIEVQSPSEYCLIGNVQRSAEEMALTYRVVIPQANSRVLVAALRPLLDSHPEGPRAIGRIVARPIPGVLAPFFLRFLREREITLELDDHLTFIGPLPGRRPLRLPQ